MGMTQAAYEALSAEKKQAALDRARQVFLEAGADDVLLNIEQLPAWIQAVLQRTAFIRWEIIRPQWKDL